jgi:hypothetical protein
MALRPTISVQVLIVFLCLQANAETVAISRVDKFPKLILLASDAALPI